MGYLAKFDPRGLAELMRKDRPAIVAETYAAGELVRTTYHHTVSANDHQAAADLAAAEMRNEDHREGAITCRISVHGKPLSTWKLDRIHGTATGRPWILCHCGEEQCDGQHPDA